MSQKDKYGQQYWWQFLRTRPEMYSATTGMKQVIVTPWVAKHIVFELFPTNFVFGHPLIVFCLSEWPFFTLLQSTIHEVWVRERGSTMETRSRYTPTDCFEVHPEVACANLTVTQVVAYS